MSVKLSEATKNSIPSGYSDKNEISNFGPSIVQPIRSLVSLLEDALYRTFLCEMIGTAIVFVGIAVIMTLSVLIGAGVCAALGFVASGVIVEIEESIIQIVLGILGPVGLFSFIGIGGLISAIIVCCFGCFALDVPRRLSVHVEERLKGEKADFQNSRDMGKATGFVFMLFFTTWLEGMVIGFVFFLISVICLIIPVIGWIVYIFVLILFPFVFIFWIGFVQFKVVFIARKMYSKCLSWCWKHKGAVLGFGIGTFLLFVIPIINIFSFFSNVIASTRIWMYVEYYQNLELENELKEEKPVQQTIVVVQQSAQQPIQQQLQLNSPVQIQEKIELAQSGVVQEQMEIVDKKAE